MSIYKEFMNRDFLLLCVANFLSIFAQRMTNATLSLYTSSLGSSSTLIGFVFSAFTITSLLLLPFSGQVMNHFSKKRITCAASFVIALATFGFSIAKGIEMLVVFRLLQGCGLAFYGIGCLTLATNYVEATFYSLAVAYYSISTIAAQAIGPGSGLILAERFGYIATLQISAALILTGSLLLLMTKKDFAKKEKFHFQMQNICAKEAVFPGILIFIVSMTNITISSFLALYAYEKKIEDVAIFFTVNAITVIVVRPLIDQFNIRMGSKKLLRASLLMMSFSFIVIGFAGDFYSLVGAAVINALGYGTAFPILESLSMQSVSADRKALANTTSYIGSNLGILIGPILAGAILDISSYTMMFFAQAVLVFAAVILLHNKKAESD